MVNKSQSIIPPLLSMSGEDVEKRGSVFEVDLLGPEGSHQAVKSYQKGRGPIIFDAGGRRNVGQSREDRLREIKREDGWEQIVPLIIGPDGGPSC